MAEPVTRDHRFAAGGRTGSISLTELASRDVPRIARLERESWPEPMRVDEATVARRFELGHVMLGFEHGKTLLGLVAFSYTHWSPASEGPFPSTHLEFSTQPMRDVFDTAFAYNLVLHPTVRGSRASWRLIAAGLERVHRDGCRYVLGHSRCPSYNGIASPGIEHTPPRPAFRRAMDRALEKGVLPAREDLLLDPVLRFYERAVGCNFLRVMPGFLPDDRASGGMAVRFVKELPPGSARGGTVTGRSR